MDEDTEAVLKAMADSWTTLRAQVAEIKETVLRSRVQGDVVAAAVAELIVQQSLLQPDPTTFLAGTCAELDRAGTQVSAGAAKFSAEAADEVQTAMAFIKMRSQAELARRLRKAASQRARRRGGP